MRYTLVAVIIMAGLLMGCVSSKNTPGQEKFCTDLVNALKLSGDSRTDRYSRCLSEMANPIKAEPRTAQVTKPYSIQKSGQTLKRNVTEIMKYGLSGAPTPVNPKILNDYDLCVSVFNAYSDGARSAAYKNSMEEIRDRKISCKEYSRTIVAEERLKIVEEKLEATKKQADQRQAQENFRRTTCSNMLRSPFYKQTGYKPPSCY